MSGDNPFFKELEMCASPEKYVGRKVSRGLSLNNLVTGDKYHAFSCRPKNLDDYRKGYHHIGLFFTFRGSTKGVKTSAGRLVVVKADVSDLGVTPIPAHMLGLTPYDGWGDEDAPDTSFSAGKDPLVQNYRGKWNHFSYVILAPRG